MNDISGGVVTSIIGKLGLDNGVELVRHTSIESQFYELERSSIISFPFEHLISKNLFPARESSSFSAKTACQPILYSLHCKNYSKGILKSQ